MKIEYVESSQLPRSPTFRDVAVGQVFFWKPSNSWGLYLKVSESKVYIFAMNGCSDVTRSAQDYAVSDVSTIESITLRRVK